MPRDTDGQLAMKPCAGLRRPRREPASSPHAGGYGRGGRKAPRETARYWADDAAWGYYNDEADNSDRAGNQQRNPEAALVEKLARYTGMSPAACAGGVT